MSPGSGRAVVTTATDAVRRASQVLDPRSGFTYQRSVVQGKLGAFGLETFDLSTLDEVAKATGYRPTAGSRTYYHPWFRVTVRYSIVDEESRDGSASLHEEIDAPKWFVASLLGAVLAVFGWLYLPRSLGTTVLVGATIVFALLLIGFIIVPSPLARYLDNVREQASSEENEGTQVLASDSLRLPAESHAGNALAQADRDYEADSGPAERGAEDRADDRDTSAKTSGISTVIPTTFRTSCLGPPMTALLGGFAASGPVFVTGLPLILRQVQSSPYIDLSMFDLWFVLPLVGAVWMLGFWVVGFLVGLFIYAFEDETARIRVFPFDLVTRIDGPVPELSGGYLSLLGVAILPLFALTNSYFLLPAVYRLPPVRTVVYFLFPAALVAATLPVFVYWWLVQNREYVYLRTIASLNELSSLRARVLVAVLITGLSYLLAATLHGYVLKYWNYLVAPILNKNLLPVIEKPVLMPILIASAVPAVYLLVGVGYQLIVHILLLVMSIIRSERVGETPIGGYPVRLLPDDDPQAYAIAFGPWRAVLVSVGVHQRLSSRKEFAALLAHEEAHFQRNSWRLSDAQLGTLLPVLGALTLTGKNILYALADFRSREKAADDYAARIAGEESLISALDSLTNDETVPGGGVAFLPLPGIQAQAPMARPSTLRHAFERYFGLLFGSFAMARAHPSLSERKTRLKQRIETLGD